MQSPIRTLLHTSDYCLCSPTGLQLLCYKLIGIDKHMQVSPWQYHYGLIRTIQVTYTYLYWFTQMVAGIALQQFHSVYETDRMIYTLHLRIVPGMGLGFLSPPLFKITMPRIPIQDFHLILLLLQAMFLVGFCPAQPIMQELLGPAPYLEYK
jgi:hypothetical protein